MSATAATLLILGGLLEFAGIVAVAWPDLIPWKERLSGWLNRTYGRVSNRVRRLLRRPPKSVTVQATVASVAMVGGRVAVIKGPPADGTLEHKVAHLVGRDREAQEAKARLEHLIEDLDEEVDRRVEKLREDMERQHEQKLHETMTRHRPLRILGTVLLAAGLVCTVSASFV